MSIFSSLTSGQIETFTFVFLRVSALIVTIPIIGNRAVPLRVKGGIALIVAALIFPHIVPPPPSPSIITLCVKMAGEVVIGIAIGLAGRLIFDGIQLGGQLMGFQMGFAIVNVVDPISSTQVSIIAQLHYLLSMLVFMMIDGHHIFLRAIAESYTVLAPLDFSFSPALTHSIVDLGRDIFIVGVKTGAPIIVSLLITTIGLGMIARTVPQINIFIVGFPLKIAIGLIGIGLSLPIFIQAIGKIFLTIEGKLTALLRLM